MSQLSPRQRHRVFVYGSLRQDQRYHHLLAGARRLGTFRLGNRYALYDLGAYPALREDGDGTVVGEVYLVDRHSLHRLDVLERHPLEFRRRLIPTPVGPAWIYLYQRPPPVAAARVSDGDWTRHLAVQGRAPAGRPTSRASRRR